MINKNILLTLILFTVSCKDQVVTKESEETTTAMWYFYAYSLDYKAFDKSGKEIQPLTFDLRLLRSTNAGDDTTNLFFIASSADTLNTVTFKPVDLVGIMIVRTKLYLPIYHRLAFDPQSDSFNLQKVKMQDELLQNEIKENRNKINPWLKKFSMLRRSKPVGSPG